MTNTDSVIVEQIDRDAAHAICEIEDCVSWSGNMIRDGKVDHHQYVQAFARNRLAAKSSQDEAMRVAIEALEKIANGNPSLESAEDQCRYDRVTAGVALSCLTTLTKGSTDVG